MTRRDLRGLEGLDALVGRPFTARPEEVDLGAVPARLAAALGVPPVPDTTPVVEEGAWTRDGVDGLALRWSTGFGPDTRAWLLRPAGERAPLPGIVALHCHGGMKFHGKEKIADGPVDEPRVAAFRAEAYDGIAVANAFARAGFAVLAHDAFGWGSRRMRREDMPERTLRAAADAIAARGGALDDAARYDLHAGPNEDAVAKILGVLGTSWGGLVARDDLIAARVLAARADVRPGGVVLVGLSGGGARAALASALDEQVVRATAVVAMMATFDAMLDGYTQRHTWMLMNPGMARVGEWPDIAAARAPRPLFVGFARRDALFPLRGMLDAEARLRAHYRRAGAEHALHTAWVDRPHSFGADTQQAFLAWAGALSS